MCKGQLGGRKKGHTWQHLTMLASPFQNGHEGLMLVGGMHADRDVDFLQGRYQREGVRVLADGHIFDADVTAPISTSSWPASR